MQLRLQFKHPSFFGLSFANRCERMMAFELLAFGIFSKQAA